MHVGYDQIIERGIIERNQVTGYKRKGNSENLVLFQMNWLELSLINFALASSIKCAYLRPMQLEHLVPEHLG